MNRDFLIKTIRWVAVLPTAAVGLFLGSIFSNIFFTIQGWFLGIEPDSGFGKINFWIISSAIGSGACVYFGSKVAPSHRKIVSMVLGVLIVSFYAIGLFSSIFTAEDQIVWKTLSAVAAIFTAGVVVYNFFEQGDDFDIPY